MTNELGAVKYLLSPVKILARFQKRVRRGSGQKPEFVAVKKSQVAELKMWYYKKGHKGKGHEGGAERGSEGFREAVDGFVFFGDVWSGVEGHQAGDGEGED